MLLNDIDYSANTSLKKINQYLEVNYGFKISENAQNEDLKTIIEHVENEIINLKVKGQDAKTSPEISKRLLILEALKDMHVLNEYAILQLQSPDLDHVVNGLSDFVHDSFRLSGTSHEDFDECVKDGMKHYRSSKYRFPDDLIEQRVREQAMARLMGNETHETEPVQPADEALMGEEKENSDSKIEEKSEGHQDPWTTVGKRSSAFGGHMADVPTTNQAKKALKTFNNPKLELEPIEEPKNEPMVKNPRTGRMEPDPFAKHQAELRKGIVHEENMMKENLVKNLRRLLETEVTQAEVMIAAKDFADEMQEMIEKIGRLQNEDLPPVTDKMRETYGLDSSSTFQTQMYGALQGVMDALYTAKTQVSDAVSTLASTGHLGAETDMDKDVGMEPGNEMEPPEGGDDIEADLDLDNIGPDLDHADEFGGAEEEEPLGRSKKMESQENLKNKVAKMKRLVERARKLKEAKKTSA